METHQNMQYACSACNHVSRSRDALRKHVSYRHPPSAATASDGTASQKKQQQHMQPWPSYADLHAFVVEDELNYHYLVFFIVANSIIYFFFFFFLFFVNGCLQRRGTFSFFF